MRPAVSTAGLCFVTIIYIYLSKQKLKHMTNQEVYDNGEIQEIEYSRTIKGIKFYYYTIFYEGKYYEIVVSDDDINQEVENPDDKPRLIGEI